MRAVWYDRQGPANEVIVTGELPTPEPGTGRCGCGWKHPASIRRTPIAGAARCRRSIRRVIPNSDGAGIVDKVGEGVSPRAGSASGSGCTTASATDAGWARRRNTSRWTSIWSPNCPTMSSFAAGRDAGHPGHDRAWLRVRRRRRSRARRADHRRCRRGRALRRATRRMGRCRGHRDGQFRRQGRACAGRRRGACDQLPDRGRRRPRGRDHRWARASIMSSMSIWAGTCAAVLGSVRDNGSIAYYASNGALEPEVNLRALMAKNLTVRGFVLPTSPHASRKRAQIGHCRVHPNAWPHPVGCRRIPALSKPPPRTFRWRPAARSARSSWHARGSQSDA